MANELLKAQIEAALFLSEKPMKAANVARIVNADVDVVRQLIIELIHDYEARNGGLEVSDDDGYIIQVKDEYTNLVDEFVPIDMPTALIRTLSAIAIKQPVMQSEVIKIRGAGAYDHIKELIERELISKREEGRSPILTTTKKFQEYFRLSKDGKHFRSELSGESKVKGQSELVDTEALYTATETVTADATVFDASPDPHTPPIGEPGSEEINSEEIPIKPVTAVAEQVDAVTTGEDKANADAFVDSSSASETTTLQ
jgi:segregation and condensation protein B